MINALSRDAHSTNNDLSILVSQLTNLTLPSGESALQIFLENARARVTGTMLEQKLAAFQQQLITQAHNTKTITESAKQPQSFQNVFSEYIPSQPKDDTISIFYCYTPEEAYYCK